MDFIATVSVFVCLAVWGGVYKLRIRHPLDPLAILMYSILLRFVVRPGAIALGLDSPHPENLFSNKLETSRLIVTGEMYTIIWLISLAVATGLPARMTDFARPLVPRVSRDVSMYRALFVTLLFTIVSSVCFYILIRTQGNIADIVRAAKMTKDIPMLGLPMMCGMLGAFLGVAVVLRLIQKQWHHEPSISPLFIPVAFGMMLVNGLFVFACGTRSTIVYSSLALAIGLAIYKWNRISLAKIGVIGVLVIGLAVALRFVRDLMVWDHLSVGIENESPVRQFFVMANSAYFDAFMLIIRDFSHSLHYGQDFFAGTTAVVPQSVWPDRPDFITPGSALRMEYEKVSNGWPPGSIGEWYWNFGVLGVIASGLVSGLVYRVLQVRYGDFLKNPFSLSLLVFFITKVFDTGVIAQSFQNMGQSFPFLALIALLMYAPDPFRSEQAYEVEEEGYGMEDYELAYGDLGKGAFGDLHPAEAAAAGTAENQSAEA